MRQRHARRRRRCYHIQEFDLAVVHQIGVVKVEPSFIVKVIPHVGFVDYQIAVNGIGEVIGIMSFAFSVQGSVYYIESRALGSVKHSGSGLVLRLHHIAYRNDIAPLRGVSADGNGMD